MSILPLTFVRTCYLFGEALFSLAPRVRERVFSKASHVFILNYLHYHLLFCRKLEEINFYKVGLQSD